MSTKNIEDAYPLSPMQEGMLFHSLLAPESGIYITQVTCRLRDIDTAVFAQVWQQLIDRQPILRSAFVWKNVEKPLQVVGRQVGLVLDQQDWRVLSASVQEERFAAYLEDDRKTGFNLMKAPAMRLGLIQTGEGDYKFLWSHHHILMDGWSASLLLSDFFSLYKAEARNENHNGTHRRPYRDYIGWLQAQDLGQAEAFWRRMLKGFYEPTRMGIELKSIAPELEPSQAQNFEELNLNISETITAGLQKLGREQQVTLNTVVQGAWGLLLSRYSGSDDVVFGGTVSGRPASLAGVEEMVGLFINTLPVRVQVKSEERVGAYLRRLQEQQVEVRQYEYSPLVEVQGWSEVGSGQSLFDTLLVFENYPVSAILKESNWGLDVSDIRSVEQSNYPLSITGLPGTSLRFNLVYDRERYDAASMAQMLAHLETLLAGIAQKPEQPVSALSLLTPAERDQILVAWNDTCRQYKECCLHELFEAQVSRTPDAPAISFEDRSLTYRQFNQRANQLARHLQRLGVGPEVLVGVLMERSLEMVIAIYAILKAGGAYVPLEPTYPRERLNFMLNDLSLPVVLTEERFAGMLDQQQAHIISLDKDWSAFAAESVKNLGVALTPFSIAYVLYTSGSTGRPKGVMNTHRGICNRVLWMQDHFPLRATDVVLQKTPFSFDASLLELFEPLLGGAHLVVARPDGHQDPKYLLDLIERAGVTHIQVVPTVLRMLVSEGGLGRCTRLHEVFAGGEVLGWELAESVLQANSGVILCNMYGPTEAAVDVTYHAYDPESPRRFVPIGKPISNTQTYILDQQLEALPVGIAGELFVGGVNLARGYMNRPDLTAEKFIPHPYSQNGGERLYRTGDIVRWLADGNIEYLGRIDQQVKIRGFRIELEEIRVALLQHPDVKDAVIATHGDSIEDRRLVGYVVAADERELNSSDLRDYLNERLPEYMVPSVFVTLNKLPLNSNGKIDYRALPQPDSRNLGLKNEYVAPRTDVEQLLRSIWHEVIGIERIGIHDNFFELGGHSILLLKVQRKIREVFEYEVALVELFKYPTIYLLSEHLKRASEAAIEPPSFQRSFDRAETRRELVSRQREARRRKVATAE